MTNIDQLCSQLETLTTDLVNGKTSVKVAQTISGNAQAVIKARAAQVRYATAKAQLGDQMQSIAFFETSKA
jgi:hypothetical protein